MPKVLIVDDSKELLDVLSLFLTKKGYKIEEANSKSTLFEQLSKSLPDLIILDVKLRDANGRDICQQLKQQPAHKHIPIILLSANPELLVDHAACNADEVIEKPFKLAAVLQKIEGVLNKTMIY